MDGELAREFQERVLQHLDSLYGYAYALTHRREDAEDLLQEALERACTGFAGYNRELPFKAWILAIIRHAYIDRYRRRLAEAWMAHPLEGLEPEPTVAESPLHAIPLDPEGLLTRRETIAQVREGIQRLPPAMREVVELRDLEGLSYREIARIVNCPIGTVMSRLYRGRNLLRSYLAEQARSGERGAEVRYGL